MNLSVNGQSQVPPGFRFHPTEEELLQYYLRKKVAGQKIDLDVIQDIDLNKLEPWDIQEKCRIGSTPQNDWYFFSHKDKKYPTGTRTNRATVAGFWKATGRDKVICGGSRSIGMRKTLVFYMGRAPHGEKSDWIMHEYRLDDNTHNLHVCNHSGDQGAGAEEGWVICRVFRKKNYVKALHNPTNRNSVTSLDTHMISSKKTHDLDQILSHMGKTTTTTNKEKTKIKSCNSSLTHMIKIVPDEFLHLPQLDSPTNPANDPLIHQDCNTSMMIHRHETMNWVELDRLVAYQLNGQATESSESTKQFSCFNNNHIHHHPNDNDVIPFCASAGGDTDRSHDHDSTYTTSTINATTFQDLLRSQSTRVFETDAIDDQFWSFTKQSSSPTSLDSICHFSV